MGKKKPTAKRAEPAKAKKKLTPRQKIQANSKRCQPKPHKGGRPSAYNSKFCDELIAFMAQGFSLTAFAGSIGVSRETIYAWTETHKEFSDALTKARAGRTLYWERRLEIAGPDARSVIFALRNSCADEWKNDPDESAGVNVTVNNEVKVDTSKPPETWGQAEIEAELRKMGHVPITTRTARTATNGNGQPATNVPSGTTAKTGA